MNINHYAMLKKLGVFASVVEQGSFTAAAEILGTAQPWVSVQVQQLEQSLGVPLLVRESRTVKLTPEGEVIFPMAQRMMATLGDVMATARDFADVDNLLRFETEWSAIHDPVKNVLIAEFVRRHQAIKLVTSQNHADHILERLISREIELAYSWDLAVDDERIEILPMVEHEVSLLIPVAHPLAEHEIIVPAMLDGFQILVGRMEPVTDTYARLRRTFDPYEVRWVVPPDPGHACRLQMTQMLSTPSLWLDFLHAGALPDDVVVRRFEGAPITLDQVLMRLAGRRNRAVDLFWALAALLKAEAEREHRPISATGAAFQGVEGLALQRVY